MLTEALTALAAAGGSAVVQAAGKDAWAGFRGRVAKWFARGDTEREQAALERLDLTSAALKTAEPGEVERVQASQQVSWQTRFEMLLEALNGQEQQRAADELRELLVGFAGDRATAIGQDAVAVAGDVKIHAESGSAAAWQIGNVQIGQPPGRSTGSTSMPDPH